MPISGRQASPPQLRHFPIHSGFPRSSYSVALPRAPCAQAETQRLAIKRTSREQRRKPHRNGSRSSFSGGGLAEHLHRRTREGKSSVCLMFYRHRQPCCPYSQSTNPKSLPCQDFSPILCAFCNKHPFIYKFSVVSSKNEPAGKGAGRHSCSQALSSSRLMFSIRRL